MPRVLIGLILLLQGCVPAQFSGYMPLGSGRLEGDHCTTIKDILSFAVDGKVELRVWIPKDRAPADLRVLIFVPMDSTVRLLSTDVVLESSEWLQPRRLHVEALAQAGQSSDLPPTAELAGKRHVNYTAWGSIDSITEGSRFWMKFGKEPPHIAPTSRARSFSVRFPELSINDEKHQVTPLLFEAYTRVGIAGFCN